MWRLESLRDTRRFGETLVRHKGLVVALTAILCFGFGVWLNWTSQRSAALPSLQHLVKDLQKRDTVLHDAWQRVWFHLPRWVTSRCSLFEPRPAALVRSAAPARIAALGPAAAPALPHMLQALSDPDWDVRLAVLEALADLRSTARPAIPTLLQRYSDPGFELPLPGLFPTVRARAATALVAIGPDDPRVLEALLASVRTHPNLEFRGHLISVLSGMQTSLQLFEALGGWLEDHEPVIRDAAIRCVGEIGPGAAELAPRLVVLFEELERKGAWTNRLSAFSPLNVPPPDATVSRRPFPGNLTNAPAVAPSIQGASAVAAGGAGNSWARYGVRSEAVEDFGAQYAIVETLGKLGPEARVALPLLSRETLHRSERYWYAAVLAKWQIDGDVAAACAALRPGLAETVPPGNRRFAIELLTRMGPGAAPDILPCLGHQETDVRFAAVRALGSFGPAAASALPNLERLLHDDPKIAVRLGAEEALRQIAPDRTWKAQMPSAVELFHPKENRH
jgi:HEAT repeat protein